MDFLELGVVFGDILVSNYYFRGRLECIEISQIYKKSNKGKTTQNSSSFYLLTDYSFNIYPYLPTYDVNIKI